MIFYNKKLNDEKSGFTRTPRFGVPTLRESGFTLLLTMLVLSIVLMVSLSVFGIIMKQLKLSSLGRESQLAFYAADSGIECTAFWDFNTLGAVFLPVSDPAPVPATPELLCVGVEGITGPTETSPGSGIFESFFEREFDDRSCVRVIVTKDETGVDAGGDPVMKTTIRADGYNLSCSSEDDKKVERTLKVSYCDGICP